MSVYFKSDVSKDKPPHNDGNTALTNFKTVTVPQVAVAFHFVETAESGKELQRPNGNSAKEEPNVFESMELDLLSYQFRVDESRPVYSECYGDTKTLTFHFPAKFSYTSEGEQNKFEHTPPSGDHYDLNAEARLSFSEFKKSGVRVWHLVVTPTKDTTFTEYDLLRFIHLWDGLSEATGIQEETEFILDGQNEIKDARTLLNKFLEKSGVTLHNAQHKKGEPERKGLVQDHFSAGTIQLSPRTDASFSEEEFEEFKDKQAIAKLCQALLEGGFSPQDTESEINTVERLNDILGNQCLYGHFMEDRQSISDHIKFLKGRYEKSKDDADLEMLNRYLVEECYSGTTPLCHVDTGNIDIGIAFVGYPESSRRHKHIKRAQGVLQKQGARYREEMETS